MKKFLVICIIVVDSANTVPPSANDILTTSFSETNVKSWLVQLTEGYTRKRRGRMETFQDDYFLEYENDPLESSFESYDYSSDKQLQNPCKKVAPRLVWRALLWLQMFLVYNQFLSVVLASCSSTSTIVSTVNPKCVPKVPH